MNRRLRLNRFVKPACLGLLGLSAAFIASPADSLGQQSSDPYSGLPSSVTLQGRVRDFKWAGTTGGHADFEFVPSRGYAHYSGLAADRTDADGKPVFASTGRKVTTQARDSSGRNRMPVNKDYISSRPGDISAVHETHSGGSLTNATNFAQWFRDVQNVNMGRTLPLTLVRQANTNIYTFNDRTDPSYSAKGGFFPINGELLGNPSGQSKNFGFTFELDTNFVYRRGTGQVFSFTGDDDVFVFIDGRLVIDIGGVHAAVSQTIELDRLNWLSDGREYRLQFFFAERHTSQSNFRIDTTINLQNANLPTAAGLFD